MTCPLYRGLKPDDPDRGRGWRPDYFPDESRMLAGKPFFGDISWHCKKGDHSLTREDWAVYIADARRIFQMER